MTKNPLLPRPLLATALLLALSLAPRPIQAQVINDPPAGTTNIITFPSRDFVSIGGMLPTDQVDVQVFRKGIEISHCLGATPIAGLIDVNHPGGYCWNVTPELRVGDIVRTTAKNPDGTLRQIDQTHVSGVVCGLPVMILDDDPATPNFEGIVEVHGLAQGLDGNRIPIDQLEQRDITKNGIWDFIANLGALRDLRAGVNLDGTLTYDVIGPNNPLGLNWTARFTNLDGDDVARFMGKISSTTRCGLRRVRAADPLARLGPGRAQGGDDLRELAPVQYPGSRRGRLHGPVRSPRHTGADRALAPDRAAERTEQPAQLERVHGRLGHLALPRVSRWGAARQCRGHADHVHRRQCPARRAPVSGVRL
jgi:hypothetical protein